MPASCSLVDPGRSEDAGPRAALAAWRAELAASRRSPWLASLVLRDATAIAGRAAAIHARLAALPRRTRRRLAKQWAMALPVAALALAWSGGGAEAATITVGDGCSLVDAIHAANGDEAVGGCAAGSGADTVVLGGGTYSYRDPENSYLGHNALPHVTTDVTIEGRGATIQRDPEAGQAFRIFLAGGPLLAREFGPRDAHVPLTLRDLTLRGGYAGAESDSYLSGDGGSILSLGALRLERVTIDSSQAVGLGGAIAQRYGTAELIDTVVTGCDASWGGAIAVSESDRLEMQGGAVERNTAWTYGGGIYAQSSSLSVQGTRIASNTAYGYGGGLSIRGGRAEIRDAVIAENETYEAGGGLHADGAALDVLGGTIEGNRAEFVGGGIDASGYPVRIRDSVVRQNEAASGGGLALHEHAEVSGTRIEDNVAQALGDGGGIYARGDVTVLDSILSGNRAMQGGAVFNGGEMRVLGGHIDGNTAYAYGGGLFNGWRLTMVGASLQGNHALHRGGGLSNEGWLRVDDSTFDGNSAGSQGGGIHSGALETGQEATLQLANTVVSGNHAQFGGGVEVDSRSARTQIVDSEIRGNQADEHGGGLSLYGVVDLSRTTIADNSAYGFGGGVYNRVAELSMRDCTVTGNAAREGGGLYNLALLDLRGGTLAANRAEIGGGVFNRESATLLGATLRENTAAVHGGAIYDGGHIALEGLTIQGNEAGADGGGVASLGHALALVEARVTGNVAGQRGGGIFDSARYELTLLRSTVDANEAAYGGGIYARAGAELVDSTLSGNRAELSGAAVHATWAITITQSTLADNDAAAEGGGSLYQSSATALLSRSILTSAGVGGDCAGAGTFRGTDNLVDDFAQGACADIADAAVTGLAPELAANGGPTLTRALLPDSNAIDAVSECVGLDGDPLAADQRGAPRPQDGDGDGAAACDIGAYERADNWALSVTIEGPGRGTVHGPAFLEEGIACGEGLEDCAESYANGMEVALEARPWPGWLAEWSGDCDEHGRVVMDADRTCSLRFVADPTGGPIFLPAVIKE